MQNEKNRTEITPLLENFTRKFAEQVSVARCENVCQTQSQHVPAELLRVYQQQSPFNPTFDAESSCSFTSSTLSRASHFDHDYFDSSQRLSRNSNQTRRKKHSKFAWFTSNLTFFFSILAFSVGMLSTPMFFTKFFLYSNSSNNSTLKNLLIISLIEIILVAIVFGIGLILLYAGSKLSSALRRKNQQFSHFRTISETPWFAVTYERIVASTLGDFASKILSVILIIHLFGLSTLIIIFMSDMMDVFFSSILITEHVNEFCKNNAWFLNHEVTLSVWLLFVSAVLLLGCSFYKKNRHQRLLTILKRFITFFGILSTGTLIVLLSIIFYKYQNDSLAFQEPSLASTLTYNNNSDEEYSQNPERICLNSTQSWSCIEQRWLLLLCSIPLLLLPFHFNEFLVVFLFANKHEETSSQSEVMVSDVLIDAASLSNNNNNDKTVNNNNKGLASNNPSSNNLSIDSGTQSEDWNGYNRPRITLFPPMIDDNDAVMYANLHAQLPYQFSNIYPSVGQQQQQQHQDPQMYLTPNSPYFNDPSPVMGVSSSNHHHSSSSGKNPRSFQSLRSVFFWSLVAVLVLNLAACVSLYFMQNNSNSFNVELSTPVSSFSYQQLSSSGGKNDENDEERVYILQKINNYGQPKYISHKIKVNFDQDEPEKESKNVKNGKTTSTTRTTPTRIVQTRPQKLDSISFEINFLRYFFRQLHNKPEVEGNSSALRTLLIITSGLFLLKCTFVYLLIAVRGLISYEIAFDDRQTSSGFCLRSFLFIAPFILWNLLTLLSSLVLDHYLRLVQITFLIVCWLGCFLMFVFPSLILFYLSIDSLRRNRNPLLSTTKPLSWPKSCLLVATILLTIGISLVVLWPYGYCQSGENNVLSPIPLIAHNDTRSIYCDL